MGLEEDKIGTEEISNGSITIEVPAKGAFNKGYVEDEDGNERWVVKIQIVLIFLSIFY